MNCRDAQTDIALFAGGDLDDDARIRELRQHVAACPGCKRHYHATRQTLKLLAGVGSLEASSTWESAGSLWPAVEREISRPPRADLAARLRELRHWTPFVAATAACGVMLAAFTFRSAPQDAAVAPRNVIGPPLSLTPEDDSAPKPARKPPESPGTHFSEGHVGPF